MFHTYHGFHLASWVLGKHLVHARMGDVSISGVMLLLVGVALEIHRLSQFCYSCGHWFFVYQVVACWFRGHSFNQLADGVIFFIGWLQF